MQASLYAIGQLARLSGLPVKTIRFYADEGLLEASRSPAGHRRFDETAPARLQLIRTFRELGVDLATIRALLSGHGDLAEVLRAHVLTLETRIRSLQRQLVVLRAAADSPSDTTLRRVQALAELDADERRLLLERFWDAVTGSGPLPDAVMALRQAGIPALPDEPTPEQLDAWIELAQLAVDEDFQQTTRANAAWPASAAGPGGYDVAAAQAGIEQAAGLARTARTAGLAPDDPGAAEVVEVFVAAFARALHRRPGRAFERWLLEQHDVHTDPRAARYWQLVAIASGRPPPADNGPAADYLWLLAALRARVEGPRPPARVRSATRGATGSRRASR